MYTISKETDSIVLICHDCSHTERIDSFNESFGSRSTQAARAMQNHAREKHGVGSVLKPIPKNLRGRGAVVTSGTLPIPQRP
jgi:hypothetical protein